MIGIIRHKIKFLRRGYFGELVTIGDFEFTSNLIERGFSPIHEIAIKKIGNAHRINLSKKLSTDEAFYKVESC